MDKSYGWAGKVLHVDLTNKKVEKIPTSDYRPEEFIGGVGLNARIFWELGCPEVGAFDPDNPLIISVGPLTGIYSPFGRAEVGSISPQCYPDELFTYSGFGGMFPAEMKYAGYDSIIITGKVQKPVYLSIVDDEVKVKDAQGLWGMDTFEAQEKLMIDEPGFSNLVIGPAGENLSRMAIILNETECAAGQGGFGAVMGSKNLKAISVKGTGGINIAEPNSLMELIKLIVEESNNYWVASGFRPPFAGPPEIQEIFADRYYRKQYGCYGCPHQCHSIHEVTGIGRGGVSCINSAWWRYSEKPEDIWEAHILSQKLGINAHETVLGIPYILKESYDQGILQSNSVRDDLGLPVPFWLGGTDSNHEFLTALLGKIASGEKPYSEGTVRFFEYFKDKPEYGSELMAVCNEFCTIRGYALHYLATLGTALHWAVDTRDPLNSCHDPLMMLAENPLMPGNLADHFGLPATEQHQTMDTSKTDYQRVEKVTAWGQDNQSLKNSLPVCEWFACPTNFYDSPDMDLRVFESRILSAVTGLSIDTASLAITGERITNLIRAIMVKRENRTRENDTLNEPYFKKVIMSLYYLGNFGPIDKEKFEQLKDRYYQLRGWDVETGQPTRITLEELGLGYVADELANIGRLS
jgi:aldehyde:ferredoxin oxidoreductase